MRMLLALSVLLTMVLVNGCMFRLGPTEQKDRPVWQSNKSLQQQKTIAENKARTLEDENKQLKQQVETLGTLDKAVRLENLYDIQAINIGSSTGIYAKKNDKKPYLVVYFSPTDQVGDAIKASGTVTVELWNLAGKEEESLIQKWEVGPDSLKKDWGIGLMNAFYRLSLNLPDNLPKKSDYVVRISFTDYLSGKVLTGRKIINKTEL